MGDEYKGLGEVLNSAGSHYYVVAVYTIDAAYGGPEEGGWWYTEGDLSAVVDGSSSEDEAYQKADTIRAKLGFPDRVSVQVVDLGRWVLTPEASELLEDDWDYVPVREDYVLRTDVPQHFPEHRPYYR
jgi:hypothetical protein